MDNKEFDELSNTFVPTASNTVVLSPDNVHPACEYGKCEYCGKEASLGRTYWYYPVKCDCHTPTHFELVRHCNDCTPVEPKQTMICTHHEDHSQWNILVPTNIFIKTKTND